MSLIFEQYSERLQRKVRGGQRSPHTVANFNTITSRLDRWLFAQGLTAETASMPVLEEYFDQLTIDMETSSAATHFRTIRAAYNHAMIAGSMRHNPTLDLNEPKARQKEIRVIPNQRLREIKATIQSPRDWIFFHLLIYTGMRRNEIRTLIYDDGSEDANVLRIPDKMIRLYGKGRKLRLVPVHPALAEVLAEEEQEPGRFVVTSRGDSGVAVQTIQDTVRRFDPVYTAHDYRRTAATSLRVNGVDSTIRDAIMGWQPEGVFQRFYNNISMTELHRAILKLYADDPIA
jgi:integrase